LRHQIKPYLYTEVKFLIFDFLRRDQKMEIKLRKSAIKDLKRISNKDKQRLHLRIRDLTDFPNITNCKKLTNFEPAYRLRVGNYRILFDVVDDEIQIGRILHRKESYSKS